MAESGGSVRVLIPRPTTRENKCSPNDLHVAAANMKVITAIYLHCRPDLRDEWLAGIDVDADVEESLVSEAST